MDPDYWGTLGLGALASTCPHTCPRSLVCSHVWVQPFPAPPVLGSGCLTGWAVGHVWGSWEGEEMQGNPGAWEALCLGQNGGTQQPSFSEDECSGGPVGCGGGAEGPGL